MPASIEASPSLEHSESVEGFVPPKGPNSGGSMMLTLSAGCAFSPRPELADVMAEDFVESTVALMISNTDGSTAEIAASSPRYRRRSSTFIDGVHDLRDEKVQMAPAQLYSTMSGRLFHSGRIAIVLVGPPARGKT